MNDVVTIIAAVVTACGASLIQGMFSRPKVSAEAQAQMAAAVGTSSRSGVDISADAREWARLMSERAEKAEVKADRCSQKVDELEHRLDHLEDYNRLLIRQIVDSGHVPIEFDFSQS